VADLLVRMTQRPSNAELTKAPVLRRGYAHNSLWFDAVLNAGRRG